MRTLYNSTNYGNDLRLTRLDANSVCHSGSCDDDVDFLMQKKYIKIQLDLINPEQLRKELYDYGAWTDEELINHTENLKRWVWISGGDIAENK